MSNEIKIWDGLFGSVRVVMQNGNPWFVGNDIAENLGYQNPRDALAKHCKGCRETRLPTTGGDQVFKIIPEGDVYRLVARSRLPTAERFEAWLFDEVVPSIRKTGAYQVTPATPQIPRSFADALQLAADQARVIENQAKTIEAARPAVAAQQLMEASEGSLSLRLTAKGLGVKPGKFNAWLVVNKVMYRQSGRLVPYQHHIDVGRFELKLGAKEHSEGSHAYAQPLVTPVGQAWLARNIGMLQPPELMPQPKKKRTKRGSLPASEV